MSDYMRWERLDSYFSGECTPEEAQSIERWIAAMPERRQRIEALRTIWARAGGQPDRRWDARAAWERLAPTLEAPVPERSRRKLAVVPGSAIAASRGSSRWRSTGVRVAATIALLVGGVTLWQLVLADRVTAYVQRTALHAYVAPRGQRATLTLADGSRVILAPGSTLRARPDLGRTGRRDVYLEGEAFFEVRHEADRPFIVHTANATAEDLGTRFVVAAYPQDTVTRVVVAEGVVGVRGLHPSNMEQRVLHAADLAWVDRAGRIETEHQVAVQDYFSWTSGQLIFRNALVRDVVPALARWYGIDIRIDPAASALAGTTRVTLTTEPNQPLDEALTALTLPVGLQARWTDGVVVVGP